MAVSEWKLLDRKPEIKLLPGEHKPEHVVTAEEEAQYLAVAEREDPEIGHVMICLLDTGLRPDEFYRMGWEHINWKNGSNGSLFVAHGKTPSARRVLHLSPRLRFVLEARWEQNEKPAEGWVWKSATKSGHFEQSTIKKRYSAILKKCDAIADEEAKKPNGKPVKVRPFIPYDLRHTFLTRLGESGCDVWTFARIAGHSNVEIGQRYVHPSEQAVSNVFSRQSGHKIGHAAASHDSAPSDEVLVTDEQAGVKWRSLRDDFRTL